jgi:uracil-DNA glycosylase
VLFALGNIAHQAILRALDHKIREFPFKHGACYELPGGRVLFDSYHCSRYNTNTGRLTTAMFEQVFAAIARHLAPERTALSVA